LNFNQDYDAFVQISGRKLTGKYLVNPVDKTYYKLNSDKAVVEVPKFSPALWIVTSDNKRLAGCRGLEQDKVANNYKTAKKEFLSASGKAKLQLGRKGKISINYGQVKFGGKDTVALKVSTPAQTVSFSKSGGRIISWIAGGKQFVGGRNFSSDGFCMDLLWLPAGARWSGDQIRDMRLVKCLNDGKNATVEYAGEFKKGFPNLRIIKTYTIAAAGRTVKVNVRLINGTPLPITVSYWNHNVLPEKEYCFLSGKSRYSEGGSSIFTAKNLPEKSRQYICMPKHVKGEISSQYTECDNIKGGSVTFFLPKNFLNVYRWRSSTLKMSGSEWMTLPLTIQAGTGENITFDISVSPDK
jgi:hypothetical protein